MSTTLNSITPTSTKKVTLPPSLSFRLGDLLRGRPDARLWLWLPCMAECLRGVRGGGVISPFRHSVIPSPFALFRERFVPPPFPPSPQRHGTHTDAAETPR